MTSVPLGISQSIARLIHSDPNWLTRPHKASLARETLRMLHPLRGGLRWLCYQHAGLGGQRRTRRARGIAQIKHLTPGLRNPALTPITDHVLCDVESVS